MGSPPLDSEEIEMLERSLQKSYQKFRPRCVSFGTFLISIFNWILNIIALIFLLLSSVSKTLGSYGLHCWIIIMDNLGRKRVIMDRVNDEPYLERYYIFLKDRSDTFPFNVFIHKFLKSDPDDLHDHPWGYFTFIISGGYWEYMYGDYYNKESKTERQIIKVWRGPGFYQSVPASHTHRVELDPEASDCWTLFIPRMRVKKWGFFKDNKKWIEADQYLAERQKEK